jgi:soluble lytic murein transglycosylase
MRVAPSGFWAGRFWLNRGLRAESDGRSADAAAAYRRASAAAPDSDDGAEARWRLGWIALRGGRLDDAEARFRTAGRTATGRSDAARAWYWVAKTIEARTGPSGEGEAAAIIRMVADQYPLTFYGQRARARVGTPSPTLPFSPLPVIARGAPAPAYEELARLGIDAEAAAAAEDALSDPNRAHAGRDPRVVDFLAETYGRLGEVQQSVAYAEEAIATGRRDAAMWRLAYPKAFWPQVKAAAQAENINPLFLLALVREESRYDAAAISPARAVGLAQLLPSTARAMTGDPSIGVLQLQNPQTNLRLGARYIRLQMDRFAGDLRLTLAAYNAGPGAARRWMNLDADPDYFIEKIGYAETRAYIRRVMGSYGIYTLLW